MSLLKSLASSDDTIKGETDSIGSGGVLNSGAHLGTVTLAYVTKAASEALGLVINAKTAAGRELRQTLWMTSGKAKGGKNYYEKDGQKSFLPGYLHADSLALLTVGKSISELDTEEKVVNVYSADAKADVPTKVQMVMDLLGQEIYFGVIKQVVDKTKKNDAGVYVATGDTREENEIDKLFRAKDKLTTAEIRAGETTAVFFDTWTKKWEGQVKQRAKGAAGAAGVPGAAPAAGGTAKPTKSLFG